MATKKTTTTPVPSQQNGLAERAMIVRLTIGRWYGTVTDSTATKELAEQKHAKEHMLNLRKHVISRKALLPINQVTEEARATHRTLTLPWTDGGHRILSADAYFTYMEKQRKCNEEFDAAVEAFLPTYENWYQQSKEDLGDLWRELDLPRSARELRRRFYFNIRVYPLPQATDFRVALGNQDIATVRATIEADLKDVLRESMREPWQRLHTAIGHLIERLNAEKGFRASTIDNLRELVETIPLLNITGDPQLAAIAADVGRHLLVDPDQVRDSKKLRTQTAADADKILKKLEAFI